MNINEAADKEQRDREQHGDGAGLQLNAVFADISADEVVGDGVDAHPPRRDKLLIGVVLGRGRPPGRGVKVEDIEHRGDHRQENEGCDEHLLLTF